LSHVGPYIDDDNACLIQAPIIRVEQQ